MTPLDAALLNHADRSLLHLGIDLGGTNLRVGAFDQELQLIASRVSATRVSAGPEAVVLEMAEAIASLLDETGGRAGRVGLGSPGPINLVTGTLGELPNFPGWQRFPLRAALEEATGLEVHLDCDANAAALAEWKMGAGRAQKVHSMAMLALGTGVGSGLILEGRVWQGMVGMGGEVGHVSVCYDGPVCSCGGRGCLELYASATAIERAARRAASDGATGLKRLFAKNPSAAARDIAALAQDGDADAMAIYREVGCALGRGLAGLVNTLDLPLYVLGGGVAAAWNLFAAEMFRVLREQSYVYRLSEPSQVERREMNRPFVTCAELGPDAGLIGAAILSALPRSPSSYDKNPSYH
ncbi:MAG TPA: ROK family protein [Acidobacteriaceae bacterium]|nr:ROK family protein [Acidobacteriaceae bacterium]